MNKFGQLIEQARKPLAADDGEEKKAATKKVKKKTTPKPKQATKRANDRDVNLTIKVSETRRRHWAAEAKRAGITITEIICEALSKKFGEPPEAQ
jgi:hypothetical protein